MARAGFAASAPDEASREHLGGDAGPHTVIDTTGRPDVLQTGLDLVANGGRVVVVGLTVASAPVCSGTLPHKELDVLGVSEDQVVPTAVFSDDLDADSLDLVELVMALEEEFDVQVPEEELEGVTTVQQAYDLVANKL